MHWTVTLKVQGRGVDKENLERKREWELQKTGESFGQNQMEERQEGPMFHKGTKGANDDDEDM